MGWKGLPRTKTLGLIDPFVNYVHNFFYNIGPMTEDEKNERKLIDSNVGPIL
jgi:hypothetical protein